MKRTITTIFFLAASAVLAFAQAGSGAPRLASNEGFVILNNLPLYLEDKGNLTFKESLVLGDKVTVLSKSSKYKINGNERDYTKVRAPSGNEGWVRSSYVVQKCSLAVVKTDKATVYSEPRDVKITSKTISAMTIVAVLDDGTNSEFAKLVCYDTAQDAYYTDQPVFLSADDLSSADADVNSVILYTTAMATKSKDIRANLFKVVQKRYSNSIFFDKIQAALVPGADSGASSSRPTAADSGVYIVNDSNVNVRSQPDEVNGQVLTQLNAGAQVEVLESTVKEYAVGGASAKWYRIKDPAGWVFGSFLNSPVQ
jgi:SH3-like domain-containing protein